MGDVYVRKKRIEYVDKLKGIGMILVILGHIVFPQNLRILIYAFHMPLFFFLTGITLNSDIDFKLFLTKRIKGILVPLAVFSVFQIVLYEWTYRCLITKDIGIDVVLNYFIGIFIQGKAGIFRTEFWYLSCLFISEILIFFIYKLNRKIQIVVMVIGIAASVFYNEWVSFNLPWSLNIVFITSLFIYLGRLYGKYDDKLSKIVTVKCSIFYLFIFVITAKVNSYFFLDCETVNLGGTVFGNYMLFFVSAISGILFVLSLFRRTKIEMNHIQYIGRNSIIYYGMHIVVRIVPEYIAYHVFGNWIQNEIARFFIGMGELVFFLPIIYLISKFINKKLPFIIGKKQERKQK